MKTSVAVALLLSALAGGTGAFLWQEARYDAREAALQKELSRLGRRVDAIEPSRSGILAKALLDRVQQGNAVAAPRGPELPSARVQAPLRPAAGDPETLEQQRAAAAARRAERARALDDYLSSDSLDKAWGQGMVSAAYRAVDVAKSARVIKTDCASHLCRIVVDHADLAEQRSFAEQIWQQPPFDNGTFFQYDRSGPRPQTTLYVAREGIELATLIPR